MKERPILFQGAMVRALLAGTKTQTRRIAKIGLYAVDASIHGAEAAARELAALAKQSPYGQPGDRLWVRESYADIGCRLTYKADEDDGAHCMVKKWTPSIHMFRADSRILLEIVSVRVERLNDISEADAWAEGVDVAEVLSMPCADGASAAYSALWDRINGAGNWAANPWVWVVQFKRVSP